MMRPALSVTPPGPKGIRIFTGFVGYCWASAVPAIASARHAAAIRKTVFIAFLLGWLFSFDPDVGVVDDLRPLGAFGLDARAELGRCVGHRDEAESVELLLHVRQHDQFLDLGIELVDDRL